MFVPRTREEALGSVDQEIRKEQSTALGRVGARLELFLDELAQLERSLAGLTGDGRRPLLSAHAEARKQAEMHRWYLTVQREAMGIRQHGDLEIHYPIPRAIPT